MAALQQLAACNFKELHRKRSDGMRVVDAIYEACRVSSIFSAPAASDLMDRYFAIFDYAMNASFGVWIIDFVMEVVCDKHLTSDDPLEATLLDGSFVKQWCRKTLEQAEKLLGQVLRSEPDLQDFLTKGKIERELGKANIVVSVLKALDGARQGGAGQLAEQNGNG